MWIGNRIHGSLVLLVACAMLPAIAGPASATRGRQTPGFARTHRGREPQPWEDLVEGPEPTGIALSPDGRWLAVGGRDHPVRIWDTKTGVQRAELEGHLRPVKALAFSPDSRLLVTGDLYGHVRMWSTLTWELLGVRKRDNSGVVNVEFSRDGTWFLTVSDDATARVWDATTLEQRGAVRGRIPFRGYALAANGSAIAIAGGDPTVLSVWGLPSPGGHPRGHRELADSPAPFALSPTGRTLAIFVEGKIRLQSVERARDDDVSIPVEGEPSELRFSADGRTLAATSRRPEPWSGLWDLSGRSIAMLRRRTVAGLAVRYSDDGRRLYSTGATATVILDTERGDVLDELWGHVHPPTMFATAAERFVTADPDGYVAVWRTGDTDPVMTLPADLRKRFEMLRREEVHKNFRLAEAIQSGDAAEARRLVEQGASPKTCAFTGENTLMLAALRDDDELAQRVLAAGVDADLVADNGATALHYAAEHGSVRVIRRLLRRSVKLNVQAELPVRAVGRLPLRSGTPLMYAVASSSSEAVEVLLNAGAAVDAGNRDGFLPLHLAAAAGDLTIVDLLLEARADEDARFGRPVLENFDDLPGDYSTRGTTAHSPLMLAAEAGHVGVVDRLLAAGARRMLKDDDGRTALERTYAALRKALSGEDEDRVLTRRLEQVIRLLAATGAHR